jgi:hypothetical protein
VVCFAVIVEVLFSQGGSSAPAGDIGRGGVCPFWLFMVCFAVSLQVWCIPEGIAGRQEVGRGSPQYWSALQSFCMCVARGSTIFGVAFTCREQMHKMTDHKVTLRRPSMDLQVSQEI